VNWFKKLEYKSKDPLKKENAVNNFRPFILEKKF